MENARKFYNDGSWVSPVEDKVFDVNHPGNEEVVETIAMGAKADVDKAVAAAQRAFETWQFSTVDERVALLERILAAYSARADEFIRVMPQEMGTTLTFSEAVQMPVGIGHLEATIEALRSHTF